MNTKPLIGLSCLFAVTLATSTVDAGPHRNGGNNRVASRPARVGGGVARTFGSGNRFVGGGNRIGNWNGQRFSGQRFVGNRNFGSNRNWSGRNWSNNWNWHHHHRNFVFVDVGFPFWGWGGYPYYYDYGYYPYGSGYYPYGSSYGYDNRYYGNGAYGSYNYNYGNQYGYNNGYDAKVAELQRRLANAGYYRGEIDGVFGPRTKYALHAYRHDHPNGNDENNYGGSSPTLRSRPYSPPPTTTEPEPNE